MGEQQVKNITRPVHVYRIRIDADAKTPRTGALDAVPKLPLALPAATNLPHSS
jgi:hypothetical protein